MYACIIGGRGNDANSSLFDTTDSNNFKAALRILLHSHSVEGAVHQLVEFGAGGSWHFLLAVKVTVLGANTEEESGAGGFSLGNRRIE